MQDTVPGCAKSGDAPADCFAERPHPVKQQVLTCRLTLEASAIEGRSLTPLGAGLPEKAVCGCSSKIFVQR